MLLTNRYKCTIIYNTVNKQRESVFMLEKKIIIISAVLLFIIIFIFAKLISGKKTNINSVSIEKVHTQAITTEVSATGTVALADSNRFYSSSAATIKEIYIKEGDAVKKGQVRFLCL